MNAVCRGILVLVCSLCVPSVSAQDADPRPEKQAGAVGTRAGALVFLAEAHERFDDRFQGEVVERTWLIENRGPATVKIEQALAVDGTATVEAVPRVLPPGGQALVSAAQPLADHLGKASFRYALITDEPGVARYRFSLSGFVQSAFDPEILLISVSPGVAVPLSSREVDRLEVLEAVDPPAFLGLRWARDEADPQTVNVTAELRPDAPLGVSGGQFAVRTNVPHQPLAWVRYSLALYRELVPSMNPVSLGAVEIGSEREVTVEIRHRSGELPGEMSATSEVPGLDPVLGPCDDGSPACRVLKIRYEPQATGPVGGTVMVHAEGLESLPVSLSGLAVKPGTVVQQVDLDGEG